MADIVINFGDSPPAQGRGSFDHIPAGTYILDIVKGTQGTTSTEKPMVDVSFVVAEGDSKGRRVRSMFVIPRGGTDDSNFGIQRLNALLVACGLKAQSKTVKASKLLKAIEKKKVVAMVEDRILPAQGNRSETTISDPVEFHSLKSEAAQVYAEQRDGAMTAEPEPEAEAPKTKPKAKAKKAEPEPGAEPEPEEGEDGGGDLEPEEGEPKTEAVASEEDDLSDLFEE